MSEPGRLLVITRDVVKENGKRGGSESERSEDDTLLALKMEKQPPAREGMQPVQAGKGEGTAKPRGLEGTTCTDTLISSWGK